MISLRGHLEQAGANVNPGNFCALIDFCVDAGDTVLAEHFKTGAHNAQYNSPRIQNDLISCMGNGSETK